jgi:HTH-type transcriptional regulator/antitoxin HigA
MVPADPDYEMRIDLEREFRNDEEQDSAVRILTGLVGRAEGSLTKDEREYADALSGLIREYDACAYPLPKRRSSPLTLVKLLMEEHGMSSADFAIILGNATAASLFLAGKRELSKNHIRRLSLHFRIDAGALL